MVIGDKAKQRRAPDGGQCHDSRHKIYSTSRGEIKKGPTLELGLETLDNVNRR